MLPNPFLQATTGALDKVERMSLSSADQGGLSPTASSTKDEERLSSSDQAVTTENTNVDQVSANGTFY